MSDTVVGHGATVNYSIIDTDVTISAGASIGKSKEASKGITVIGEDLEIPNGTVIAAGEIISEL